MGQSDFQATTLYEFPLDINQVLNLVNNIAEGVYGIDINGKCTFCNKTALKLLRYESSHQLIGQHMHSLIHHTYPDGSAYPKDRCSQRPTLRTGEIVHRTDEWLWRKDGTGFPVEYWSYPIYDKNKIVGAIIAFLDISERVSAQNELHNSLERYRLLIESTQVVPWEYDLYSSRFTFISPQASRMFGYPITDWYRANFWESHVHPDDKINVIRNRYTAMLSQRAFEIEYRMLRQSGSPLYVKNYISVIRHNDQPCTLRGVFADITSDKLQQEQLRLAAVTFETSEAIVITDPDSHIVKTNNAFSEVTGYRADEVVGKTIDILRSDQHDHAFYNKMWHDLKNNHRWQGEVWSKRKNGELFPEWLTITAVRDEQGETSHYVAIFTDITERKDAEAKIRYQASYDALTQLPNRKLLHLSLEQATSAAVHFQHTGALLLLDLDEFKIINDSLGHRAGDKLLVSVAKRLKKLISAGDTLARIGGDEFAILIPDLGADLEWSTQYAKELGERVCRSLDDGFEIHQQLIHLSTSIGIALFPNGTTNADDLLRQADTAMFRAKANGKNNFLCFSPEMQMAVEKRLSIQSELKQAIDSDQLELYYQPQFDHADKLVGAEALVRWNHPEKGLIPPNDFIPTAEQTGLIISLGRWVLEDACKTYANWCLSDLQPPPRISVNVSSHQFHQSGFIEMIEGCLQRNNMSADKLELEITEEVLIRDMEKTIDIIQQLKDLGVYFSIDDFGTGYSSLGYLRNLPINQLKIDRSFIQNLPNNASDALITDTIIAMASHMGLQVIAEGVETAAQLAFLKEKQCDFFQGFYFSRPLPLAEFEQQILIPK